MKYAAFGLIGSIIGVIGLSSSVYAQDYPTRPITIYNQYAPGGGADIQTRLVFEHMSKSLGQPVVVEYKSGAGGMIAGEALQQAEPDGYTLLIDNLQLSNNPLIRTVSYDHQAFVPISLVSIASLGLVVPKDLPVNSVRELVDFAKQTPGGLNYGTLGPGGTSHLTALLFEKVAGIEMQEIAYKGTPEINQDIMGGALHVFFDGTSQALPNHFSGNVKVLAVTTEERLPAAPDIPTMTEEGYPVVAGGWFGLVAPKGTPKEIVDKLSAAVREAVASEAVQKQLNDLGITPVAMTPEEFAEFRRADREKWAEILEPLDLKLE